MKHYRIRATTGKNAGKYSTGGYSPRFTRVGKAWATMGVMRQHLTMIKDGVEWRKKYRKSPYVHPYEECNAVIVECEVVETTTIDWDKF